ncbi:radical SAM protein [Halorubellus sp. PRR65]|uniref:SPL family radical SAM protein n=1 Tax=Halorubellus sp. PRR65 TaxID=3098148 RepID=UPI002B256F27|nr:radical SAM protein [Halorubellus sp. PRR65]
MGIADEKLTTGDDPTESVLSKSALHSKSLCDYVINVATGCRHGCKFCYVPSTPAIRARPDMLKEEAGVDAPQKEWGQYVLYRDSIPNRLPGILERKRTWHQTPHGQGIVGISFGTDCYMDGRAGEITRQTVQALADHERYARVLTRNPILALQDLDAFKSAGKYVTIGSSISSLNAGQVTAIEPRAPGPAHRLRGLKQFAEHGVNTFVSMSPTYPTLSKPELRDLLQTIAECEPDVIFHEPINPRSGNFRMTVEAARDAGQDELATELDRIRDQTAWLEYSLRQFVWVQQLGMELELPVHLWPDSRHLKHTDGQVHDWLQGWKDRQPPENFANRPTPENPPPEIPSTLLSEFG